jgi:hypothetical protein
MTMTINDAIKEVLITLMDAYPGEFKDDVEQKKRTLKVYALALSDVPPDLLKAAALNHIASSIWFPKIAQLRESAAALVMKAAGHPDAFTAWGEVAHQLRYAGSWHAPQFTDPVIQKAVEAIGGWKMLCASENQVADRARFIQAYETFINRTTDDLRMLPQVREYVNHAAAMLGTGNGESVKPAAMIEALAGMKRM